MTANSVLTQCCCPPSLLTQAIWTWALTLHQLLIVHKSHSHNDLAKDSAALEMMRAQLMATAFDGASGAVKFDPATGDRLGLTLVVSNQQNGTRTQIGTHEGGKFTRVPTDAVWWYDLENGSMTTGVVNAPSDGSGAPVVQEVSLRLVNDVDSGLLFLPPYDTQYNQKTLGPLYQHGKRIGFLPSLLMTILNEGGGSGPMKASYDFRLNTVEPTGLTRELTHSSRHPETGEVLEQKLPKRKSWDYSPSLWSAANLCEETLAQSDADARNDPHVLLVPLVSLYM